MRTEFTGVRSGQRMLNHPVFNHAHEFGNAVALVIYLSAVTLDMSSLTGVRKLPDNFMNGCTNLTSVLLPPNVKELGANTFYGCASLTSIDMSSLTGMRKLPDFFMRGCTNLTSVKLPPNVKVLGANTFCGCTSLTAVGSCPTCL